MSVMLPLALSCGPNSGDRKLCENEARSRAVDGAESRGVMEKSPLRKKRKRSTIETTPQGFWSSSMQTSEVVFRCANMKKRQESVSCALTVSCVLNGWNCEGDSLKMEGTLEINVLMGQLKMDMSRKSSLIKSVRWKIPIRLPVHESIPSMKPTIRVDDRYRRNDVALHDPQNYTLRDGALSKPS